MNPLNRLIAAAVSPFAVRVEARLDDLAILTARPLVWQVRARGPYERLADAEFKVFSQFGDDGIIQYLIHSTGAADEAQRFVEFGSSNYVESNTRFLLLNDNWSGLAMDGSASNVGAIRSASWFWKHELEAVQAFVTRENIDELLQRHAPRGELGLLSIDVDGNDYWIWDAIESVDPRVVVVEYNSLFGPTAAVTIPYEPAFDRTAAHSSNLYWGASLSALDRVAQRKGYALVGCNSAGNNAYFVRRDVLRVPASTPGRAFVRSRIRESRGESGELTHVAGAERFELIRSLSVVDVDSGESTSIGEAVR